MLPSLNRQTLLFFTLHSLLKFWYDTLELLPSSVKMISDWGNGRDCVFDPFDTFKSPVRETCSVTEMGMT